LKKEGRKGDRKGRRERLYSFLLRSEWMSLGEFEP
jgi:hypothetical protein